MTNEYDGTGAMAAAWFGTTGAGKAIDKIFGGKDRRDAADIAAEADDEIERLREHQRQAMHDPETCNGRMTGSPPKYTPECVVLRAAIQRMAACENIYTARAIASVALHGLHATPNI